MLSSHLHYSALQASKDFLHMRTNRNNAWLPFPARYEQIAESALDLRDVSFLYSRYTAQYEDVLCIEKRGSRYKFQHSSYGATRVNEPKKFYVTRILREVHPRNCIDNGFLQKFVSTGQAIRPQ